MGSYSLAEVTKRRIGKAAVFYSATPYVYAPSPGGADLALTYLGDTEGEVQVEINESYSDLRIPEATGDAIHERFLRGENPAVTFTLWLADKALCDIISPTGNASGGYRRQRRVTEHTLVLIPEELFIEAHAEVALTATNTGGAIEWRVGDDVATPEQLAILDNSVWCWRGHFEKPGIVFNPEDAGKAVRAVRFQLMYASGMPDGDMLYTVGRPDQRPTKILVAASAA